MEIRFLGQSCVELTEGDARVLVDPFLTGNPKAAVAADELEPDAHPAHPRPRRPLRRHGRDRQAHRRAGARASSRSPNELAELGRRDVLDPNLGGTVPFDWGWVKLVPAWHTSTTPNGTVCTPAGLLIHIGDKLVYHLGDTALFSDLQLIARRGNHVDVALVPIGGHYTMDRFDAVTACEFIGADVVIPVHYDTFPPIETDAQAFKSDVENATETKVVVLAPGETHTVR